MNPKPIYQLGILACIVLFQVACHSTQSTTYTKTEATAQPKTIQLPNVTQQLQVEVVTDEHTDKEKKSTEKKQ